MARRRQDLPSAPARNGIRFDILHPDIGLLGVPNLIGWILDTFCITGTNGAANTYDYTLPELTFTIMAALSLIVAFLLKAADRKYGYHLEEPNIHK